MLFFENKIVPLEPDRFTNWNYIDSNIEGLIYE